MIKVRCLYTLILVLFIAGCSGGELAEYSEPEKNEDLPSESNTSPQFGQDARKYMQALVDIGTRDPGSENEQQASMYIQEMFTSFGYTIEEQFFQAESEEWGAINSSNIIAVKDGDSANVIIVGAHYDGVDTGKAADDNASGVAVMLEAADHLWDEESPYTIYFVTFGSEEAGLLGSEAFVSSLDQNTLEQIILMINLDSLSAGDIPYVYAQEDKPEARDWLMEYASANGDELETIWNVDLNDEEGYGTADYASFEKAGIPWIYFEATNWSLGDEDGFTQVDSQYGDNGAIIHTQYDDLEYLDETFPGRVDQRLDLYVSLLIKILTQYTAR